MPKKSTKSEKTLKTPKVRKASGLEVTIDYPQQDEGIPSNTYTIRIGTVPAAEKVEVSIDRGPWLACRLAVGFWWYDWANFAPGVHRLTARALTPDGVTGTSKQRRFQVI